MYKSHPKASIWKAFKWMTAIGTIVIGILATLFSLLNLDLPLAPQFCIFGFFLSWCGYSLGRTLQKEEALERFLNGGSDEST